MSNSIVSELSDIIVPAFVVDEVTGAANGLAGALDALGATVIAGAQDLSGLHAGKLLIADMGLTDLHPEVKADATVVFSADRSEIGLGLLIGGASGRFPRPAAAIAAGPWPLADEVRVLWNKLAPQTPLLRSVNTIDAGILPTLPLHRFAGYVGDQTEPRFADVPHPADLTLLGQQVQVRRIGAAHQCRHQAAGAALPPLAAYCRRIQPSASRRLAAAATIPSGGIPAAARSRPAGRQNPQAQWAHAS